MLKIAIIGAGSISARHVSILTQNPEYCITALTDPVEELAKSLAQTCDAQVYPDIDSLLENCGADLIDICVPAYLHYEYTKKCLEKGFHVFCEKPMAHTVADADELIRLAEKTQRFYMVGHVLRFWKEYEYLKNMIEEQPFGRLRYLFLNRQYGTHKAGSWYMDPEKCGMAPFEMLIHDTDFINYVFGLPKSVSTCGVEQPDIHLSYLSTFFHYDNDVVIQVEGGWNDSQLPFSCGFRATFDHAVLEFKDNTLTLYPHPGLPAEKISFESHGENTPAMAAIDYELQHVLECMKKRELSKKVSVQSTRDTIYLVEKQLESRNRKETVAV